MAELHFTTDNAEETADALIALTSGDSICGELEEHGGVMGQIIDNEGGPLSWYLALSDRKDPGGQALLVIAWDEKHLPSPKIMKRIFGVFDMKNLEVLYKGTAKFDIENYPTWSELIDD